MWLRYSDQIPLRRLSRRNSISSSDVREAVGEVEKRKVQSNAAAWKKAEYSKLISGCVSLVLIKICSSN